MEGKGEGEIVDGGICEGFGSEMEGSVRVFYRRWRATVTASDRRDGVDQAQTRLMGLIGEIGERVDGG